MFRAAPGPHSLDTTPERDQQRQPDDRFGLGQMEVARNGIGTAPPSVAATGWRSSDPRAIARQPLGSGQPA